MSYEQYPKDIEIETRYGPIVLAVTDRDHIYASYGSGPSERKVLTLRGAQYHPSVHLNRWSDGLFGVGPDQASPYEEFHAAYYPRAELNKWRTEVSNTARKALNEAIVVAVNDWALAHPEIFEAAQRAHVHNAINSLEAKIAEHEAKIAELRAEIATLAATVPMPA